MCFVVFFPFCHLSNLCRCLFHILQIFFFWNVLLKQKFVILQSRKLAYAKYGSFAWARNFSTAQPPPRSGVRICYPLLHSQHTKQGLFDQCGRPFSLTAAGGSLCLSLPLYILALETCKKTLISENLYLCNTKFTLKSSLSTIIYYTSC